MDKAFIVGSGPSIRHIDPYKLDGTIICINESIMKFPNADYFFSCDARVTLKRGWTYLPDHKCKVVLIEDGTTFNCYHRARGIKYQEEINASRIIKPKRRKSKVFSEELIWGQNSAHCAANFAYNLGCKTIILLGCDCQFVEGKRYFHEFPGQPKGGFFKEEWKKLGGNDPFVGGRTEWEDIVKANPNIKIINCSAGNITGIPNKKLSEL